MVFWESEFVNVLNIIDGMRERFDNDEFIGDIISEIKNLRARVPVSPGIVAMCAGSIVAPGDIEEIKENRKYLVKSNKGEEYYDYVHTSDSYLFVGNFELGREEIEDIFYIRTDTLEDFWPTLVHKVREK